MKVKELIEKLKNLNPEYEVMSPCNEGYCDINHIWEADVVLNTRSGTEPWDHMDVEEVKHMIEILGEDELFDDKIRHLKSRLNSGEIIKAVII